LNAQLKKWGEKDKRGSWVLHASQKKGAIQQKLDLLFSPYSQSGHLSANHVSALVSIFSCVTYRYTPLPISLLSP
jgi:hypothetical protein